MNRLLVILWNAGHSLDMKNQVKNVEPGLAPKPFFATALVLGLSVLSFGSATNADAKTFSQYVDGLKPKARELGIKDTVFRQATRGMTPDKSIDRLTKRQPELVKPIGGYIESRIGGGLVTSGRAKVRGIKRTLANIEKAYGVDPYVVAAIWGMETGFGRGIGTSNVFRSLATLGWKQYRGDFFEKEFFDALVIMQEEGLSAKSMVSSWAGAMGQTQFIPSSFRKYAVDFNSDGKRDLWNTTGDALASTASYLKNKGWIAGQPWGFPVSLPKGMPKTAKTLSWGQWQQLGVRARGGAAMPAKGQATLFFPAGHEGPAFLISPNYEVIRDYNSSDAYSLSVGMVADRLRGGGLIKSNWPKGKTLNKAQRMEVQKRLADKGYDVPNRTGRIIKGVRMAVRDFQMKIGATADGYPDQALLKQLRQ